MTTRSLVVALLIAAVHGIGARLGTAPLGDGQPHGLELLRYEDGQPESLREYRHGHRVGRHYGWWPNGNMRFAATFGDDIFEGEYRTWYENGRPLHVQHFRNGREEGTQRAWDEAGELYLNYEMRNGRRFGFVNAKPCLPVGSGGAES